MKKALLIVLFLLILIAIPITVFVVKQQQDIRQRAAPATTLSLSPSTTTVNVGETFTLDVLIDTGTCPTCNSISAAELHISYNSTYVEATEIKNGTFLSNVLVTGTINPGEATITLGSDPASAPSGTGTMATVIFKALADTPTPTQISFGSATQVAGIGEGANNVLIASTPATVTVGAVGGPSPTPAASATPEPSATPTTSPSPSPSSSTQTTQITVPSNGATLTTSQPTFSGVSFPNGLVVLSVNTSPVTTANVNADGSGDWSYQWASSLANGSYVLTATGTSSSGSSDAATANFTISVGSGGTNIASPSPSASASTIAYASASPASSGTAASATTGTGTSSAVPVTGATTPTIFLLGMSLLLLIFGASVLFIK